MLKLDKDIPYAYEHDWVVPIFYLVYIAVVMWCMWFIQLFYQGYFPDSIILAPALVMLSEKQWLKRNVSRWIGYHACILQLYRKSCQVHMEIHWVFTTLFCKFTMIMSWHSKSFLTIELLGVVYDYLPYRSRVTKICVSKLTIIDSDSSLSPGRHQAITWINTDLL